jgi:hypothetical protein
MLFLQQFYFEVQIQILSIANTIWIRKKSVL